MNQIVKKGNRLPREVWIASISLKSLWPTDRIEQRIKDILKRMESVYAYDPDVIVIPETYNISWVNEVKTLEEIAEDESTPGPATSVMAEVARNHNCYVVCPVITKKEGHFYNSSLLLDRQGKIIGVYHKIHPVDTEIIPEKYYKGGGVTPGELKPPVFKTDFGIVGMQICMDGYWHDNWRSLGKDGAEIVLFPSQGPFGDLLNHKAWANHYYIASATGEDARIIDISGDTIASDGEFARWVCAPVNLEKVLIHIWPQVKRFDEIQKKYGRKIRIKIYHPENWATLESLDPEVKIREVLKEFELPSFDEQLKEATEIQDKYR
ncbi:MAG TPA: carbon-nitrogen hydrolase family protein [Bacteroidales bacterium]|nr:carbon-nitrogen hydrolase family protein [Bacteroidales bacterium]